MLTSALLVAIIAAPKAIDLYFNAPNSADHDEYIPDGR